MRVAELAFPNRNWCYFSAPFLFHLMGILASTSIHGTVLVFHVLHYGYFCVFFCPRQYRTTVQVLCEEQCLSWVNWG